MNLIREFFKTKVSEFVVIIMLFLINGFILYVTNVKFSEFYYVIVLFLFIYSLYLVYGCFKFKGKYKFTKNININNIGEIESKNIIEKEYLSKISFLYEELAKQSGQRLADIENLEEDYSIWIHQAKTPIAALSLMIDSLDFEEKNDMKQEIFKINQYTEMALTNIRLQDISKDLVIKEHYLEDLVKDVLKKYALYFNYRKNTLELDNINIKVITDEKWFTYALDQIISNAVKYTKYGVVRLYLKGDYLVVEDSGVGIKEEDIPKLFTRGFTGYTGRVDKKATGLGLYMSRKILSTLGYFIYLESTIGKGTKVYIKLTKN